MSSKKVCSFEGCDRGVWARGYCGTHYRQWKTGKPLVAIYSACRKPLMGGEELSEWFWGQFERDDNDCLVWQRYLNPRGYGQVRWKGKAVLVHRLAWELHTGEVLGEAQLDHLCWNHACANVEHLRVVNNKENNENRSPKVRNASGFRGVDWHPQTGKWNARVTHNYIPYHVGLFSDKEDAIVAVMDKRAELFTHCQEAPEALEVYRRKTGRARP